MEFKDLILLLHPVIAVVVVYPLIGIVVNRALQVRQRRMEINAEGKSKILPVAGQEHVQLGKWLTGIIVGITLLALANDVFSHILKNQLWNQSPFKVLLICLLFVATIASLALLYRAKKRIWRGAFATLTGMGLVIIGCQDGIYRNTERWYMSHYYYGITAALLMIFSLAILQDIYKDKTQRWRQIHIILNSFAVLIFIGQGFTGTLSLLEIPLTWQKSYVQKLYELQCDKKPCTVESVPMPKESTP